MTGFFGDSLRFLVFGFRFLIFDSFMNLWFYEILNGDKSKFNLNLISFEDRRLLRTNTCYQEYRFIYIYTFK